MTTDTEVLDALLTKQQLALHRKVGRLQVIQAVTVWALEYGTGHEVSAKGFFELQVLCRKHIDHDEGVD
jgi:hypothetical protein